MTLSRWETDKVYPSWVYQKRIAEYLGHNPFTNPTLGMRKRNKPSSVANFVSAEQLRVGEAIKQQRIEMRLSGKEFAAQIGINSKTLINWEKGRRRPNQQLLESAGIQLNKMG